MGGVLRGQNPILIAGPRRCKPGPDQPIADEGFPALVSMNFYILTDDNEKLIGVYGVDERGRLIVSDRRAWAFPVMRSSSGMVPGG